MDWSTIIASIITVTGTIGSVFLGRAVIKNRKSADIDPIINDAESSENVYLSLEYLMEMSNCDRAYVMQFHNGGHYVSGKSQQRFSCTHEVCAKGISKECEKSQNHLVSNFNHYIKEILRNKEYTYTNIGKISDPSFMNLLESKGVKAIYNVPLKTLEGKVIGILGLDYVKSSPNESIDEMFKEIHTTEELNAFMRRQARTMTGYLI
tara:strand:+ start:6469 stop:7089 length:621 start_codon:yes stop_codon:yes gene_type:complete